MKFIETKPEDFSKSALISENGIWKLTLDQVMYGVRTRIWHRDFWDAGYALEYCAGSSPLWQAGVMQVLRTVLESHDEDTDCNELIAKFPPWVKRPIVNDPVCWQALCKMIDIKPIIFDFKHFDASPMSKQHYQYLLEEKGIKCNNYIDVWSLYQERNNESKG